MPQVVEGELNFDMRHEGDGSPESPRVWFEYPCVWTEANKTDLIQYKTTSPANGIQAAVVQVDFGSHNIQWQSSPMQPSENWTDSGFVTRTNQPGGKDADAKS
ncbi:MAG: hypothetical protein U1E05_12350, partial [Patescibacteria group bacterium]|nr:hypothetical protein [Patescibacteria group bacterium]